MIEYRSPAPGEESRLRMLWREVFGEREDFIGLFFQAAFSPDRCRVAAVDGEIAAMLYWFDCKLEGCAVAYLYGVGTLASFRDRGIATGLLDNTHDHLKDLGYAAAMLVPADRELFHFYEQLGYQTGGFLREAVIPAGSPIPIRAVTGSEYGPLRDKLLPPNGVRQNGANLSLLSGLAELYAGDGFIAAVSREEPPRILEFLGDGSKAPGLLAALEIPEAATRMPGGGQPFAMVKWLGSAQKEAPFYLGLAFD